MIFQHTNDARLISENVKNDVRKLKIYIKSRMKEPPYSDKNTEAVYTHLIKKTKKNLHKYYIFRYGWDPTKEYNFRSIAITEKNKKLELHTQPACLNDFRNAVCIYKKRYAIANRPLFYVHYIPRHKAELLLFDSQESLFAFVACRNYSVFSEQDRDDIGIEVYGTSFSCVLSDSSRILNDGIKEYRCAKINYTDPPQKIYFPGKSKNPVMSLIDYESLDIADKLSKNELVLENIIKQIPFPAGDETDEMGMQIHWEGICDSLIVRSIPYLMTALLINVEQDYFSNDELPKHGDKGTITKIDSNQLLKALWLDAQKNERILREWHVHFFALWVATMESNYKICVCKYNECEDNCTIPLKVLAKYNLNLLTYMLPIEVCRDVLAPIINKYFPPKINVKHKSYIEDNGDMLWDGTEFL